MFLDCTKKCALLVFLDIHFLFLLCIKNHIYLEAEPRSSSLLRLLFTFIDIKCLHLLQELRKLVRKVHFAQETKATDEDEEKKIEKAEIRAKKALTRFLRSLSENIVDEH